MRTVHDYRTLVVYNISQIAIRKFNSMKKEPTTFGVRPKEVVKLLKIGLDVSSTPAEIDQQKADLLSDRLSDTLPLYYSTEQKPSSRLKRLGHTIAALAGEPVGKLLQDPKTDIAIIRMTKDYGRKLSPKDKTEKTEAEHHTANTIYYAAIAHALVHHNLKISKYSYKDLQQSLHQLSKEDWIPDYLRVLFAKASEYSKERME